MIKNIFTINKLFQMKAINTELKINIINELILNAATGQQLSKIFGLSKQKMHYNLKSLLEAGLIEIIDSGNNKEVFYRAKAKNYILDFALNHNNKQENQDDNRSLINQILKSHHIDLAKIAANFLEKSLKMKAKEKLLIVTGEYNMPLVKHILIEASKRQIETTLMYRDKELLKAKHEIFSLATYSWDFEKFNRALKNSNVYLFLNGESKFFPLLDQEKRKIQRKAFARSRTIIEINQIKIALMEGLMTDDLSEENILSEITFWESLDLDYANLATETRLRSQDFSVGKTISIGKQNPFSFKIEKIICDYGSFTEYNNQCSFLSIPGGEIIFIPQINSFNGTIKADSGFAFGKKLTNINIEIINNEIVKYNADENIELIEKALAEGGEDAQKIAAISLGTNHKMDMGNINPLYKSKSKNVITIRWGENISIGGNIKGAIDWQIHLENPKIQKK